MGRPLSGVAIADTPDFGPKPWISLATVIWGMRPILVHLSWGYRAEINPIRVCVDSRCGTRPVSNPPVCTMAQSRRESGILAVLETLASRYTMATMYPPESRLLGENEKFPWIFEMYRYSKRLGWSPRAVLL